MNWQILFAIFLIPPWLHVNFVISGRMLLSHRSKVSLVTSEDELRPISLTSSLSKILDDFVVQWMIEDVQDKIDPKQFRCLKGSSTTVNLIDMIDNWLIHWTLNRTI